MTPTGLDPDFRALSFKVHFRVASRALSILPCGVESGGTPHPGTSLGVANQLSEAVSNHRGATRSHSGPLIRSRRVVRLRGF